MPQSGCSYPPERGIYFESRCNRQRDCASVFIKIAMEARAAARRFETFSFLRTLLTWDLTVSEETPRSAAISLFE